MTTKLFVSLVVSLGLSACVADVDDDDVLTGDDLESVAADPAADLATDLANEPSEPDAITNDGQTTCGGRPRLKADGPCVPN